MHAYTVEPLYVKSGQEVIAADFYRPKTEEKPAVILMAHGVAGLRQFNLQSLHFRSCCHSKIKLIEICFMIALS